MKMCKCPVCGSEVETVKRKDILFVTSSFGDISKDIFLVICINKECGFDMVLDELVEEGT